MSKRTPKKHKNNTTLLLFYVDTRKNLKAIRGNEYRFAPKVGALPTKTIMLVVRSIYPNVPQMGQKFHHSMLMLFLDSMQSFMNFDKFSIYYNLKTMYLNVCG